MSIAFCGWGEGAAERIRRAYKSAPEKWRVLLQEEKSVSDKKQEKPEGIPLTDRFIELTAEEKDDFQRGLDEFIAEIQRIRVAPDRCFIAGVVEREGTTGMFFNGGGTFPISLLFSGIVLATANDDGSYNHKNIENIHAFLSGMIDEKERKEAEAKRGSAVH